MRSGSSEKNQIVMKKNVRFAQQTEDQKQMSGKGQGHKRSSSVDSNNSKISTRKSKDIKPTLHTKKFIM